MGSRFGGSKQLESITPGGETILDFSLFDAISAGFKKFVFVVRSDILDDARKIYESKLAPHADVEFVCQNTESRLDVPARTGRAKPFGTGHAVLTAGRVVNENFCMINADDFYGRRAFESMASWGPPKTGREFSMIGFKLGNTLSSFGPVSRGQCEVSIDGYLRSVIERKGILSENGIIRCGNNKDPEPPLAPDTIVSMNFWGFSPLIFEFLQEEFERFLVESAFDETAEFYINDVVNNAISKRSVAVRVIPTDAEWIGITYRDDISWAAARLEELKEEGIYPDRLW